MKKFVYFAIATFAAGSVSSANLALNGNATAQSYQDGGHSPAHAVDGDHSTWWSSGGPAPRWWMVDIGEIHEIDSIFIRVRGDSDPLCYGNPCYDFEVWAGIDTVDFDLIAAETSTTQATYTYRSIDTSYRYFRVDFTLSNNWASWVDIVEFEVHGGPDDSDTTGGYYTEVASMPTRRWNMEAYSFGDYIYCFLGLSGVTVDSVEYGVYRYDVAEDLWEITDSTPFAGWAQYSALIGDDVYFAGGGIVAGWFKDSVFRYNIPTGQTDTLPNLPEPLISGHAFNDEGRFHLLGGHNGWGPYNANYVFDPTANSWSSEPFLPAGLQGYSLAHFDTLVYMIGGRGLGGFPSSNINLVYNTNSHTFSYRTPMPTHRLDAAYAVLNGEVYIFGGRRGNVPAMDTVQIYNPVTDTWRTGPPLPFPNAWMNAVTHGQSIYLIGGYDFVNGTDRVFRFSPFATSHVEISPDTMYVFQAYNADSLLASIRIGDFTNGHTVNDVDASTLLVNGTIAPVSWSILPSYPGFTGEVMKVDVLMAPFILGYGPLFDITTQTYTLESLFNDATEFSASGEVVMVGHLLGDVNLDGTIDVSDLTYLVEFLFGGGPAPHMFETADLDGNGTVDISDLSVLAGYLFP